MEDEDEEVPIEPLDAPISGSAMPCETSSTSSSAMSNDAKVFSTSAEVIVSMLMPGTLPGLGDTVLSVFTIARRPWAGGRPWP